MRAKPAPASGIRPSGEVGNTKGYPANHGGTPPPPPSSSGGCVSCGPGVLVSASLAWVLVSPSVVSAAPWVEPVEKEKRVEDLEVEVAREEKLVVDLAEHVAKVHLAAHRRMKRTDGRMNFDLL